MPTRSVLPSPALLDECTYPTFRPLFGGLLARSSSADAAILKIRLGAVDLTTAELRGVNRIRVLVADVSARAVEAEAYAMAVDPVKRSNLHRILVLLRRGVLEIRSAPLGGWSPDFTVFHGLDGPSSVLLGLHWFHRPFPLRGPAWAALFGATEASRAAARFARLWDDAHDIGAAVWRLMENTSARGPTLPVDTPNGPG